MALSVAWIAAVLLADAAGFRVRSKAKKRPVAQVVVQGEPGEVSGLWSFGAPGAASPGLVNTRGANQCFPGLRMWTAEQENWLTKWVDTAVTVTGVLGYRHPQMEGLEADVKTKQVKNVSCSTETPNLPQGIPYNYHHMTDLYVPLASELGNPFFTDIANVGLRMSSTTDQEVVSSWAESHGWKLAASAEHPGELVFGAHVCHLLQKPETGVCIMTFQGSPSVQDWTSNIDVTKAHFCGLVEEGEVCGTSDSTPCSTRKPGSSFVHRGFRDHLLRIIKDQSWQNNIRPLLPSCSEVHVAGHSNGGALAQLFTACVAKAPQPGEYGYEDYQHFSWGRDDGDTPTTTTTTNGVVPLTPALFMMMLGLVAMWF